jgi:hypothetical protein
MKMNKALEVKIGNGGQRAAPVSKKLRHLIAPHLYSCEFSKLLKIVAMNN